MKVRVKVPFFDKAGLHKKGEIAEVPERAFDSFLMEKVVEEKPKKISAIENETVEKPAIKKVASKKKGAKNA